MFRTLSSLRFPRSLRAWMVIILMALTASAHAADPQNIQWEDLVPPGWDPSTEFKGMEKYADLPDSDPRAIALMAKVRKVWDEAPTVSEFDGKKVRLPGYIVPLENSAAGIRELLLVPYFGACIHTPPPPANQIIHVRMAQPAKGFQSMDAVWISGTMSAQRTASHTAQSAYLMQSATMEKYAAPAGQQ